MNNRNDVNLGVRVFIGAIAFAVSLFSASAMAASPPKDVHVTNVPLPVSGSVSVSSLPPVSITLPAQPFFHHFSISGTDTLAAGVAGARLAVTTITITNLNNSAQQLFLSNPVISGSDCTGPVTGGAQPQTNVLLKPMETVQLQFPTPMVFIDSNNINKGCISAEVTTTLDNGGSVEVDVVGYAVP